MLNAGQLREFLDMFEEDEPVFFAVIHPSDKKMLARSAENNVGVILTRPTIIFKAVCAGAGGEVKEKLVATIFLTGN